MPDRSRFTKNTLFLYGLQIAKYVFPLITIPYLTRVLGPDIYAVRAYVLSAMTFMLLFLNFGFIPYGTRAIVNAASDLEQERLETSTITYLRIGFCVLGAIALIPMTINIPILAAYPLYVAISYVGTCMKALLPDFVFQGQEDMSVLTYRFVVSQAVAVVLIFAFVHSPDDLLWVAIIETIASAIGLIWSWENIRRKRNLRLVPTAWAKAKSILRQSNVFFIGTIATTAYTSVTTLLIGIYIPDQAQVAYWSLATTAIVAVQALYAPVESSLYPHMIKRRDWGLLKKLLVFGLPAVAIIATCLILFDQQIMFILGGEEYLSGAHIIARIAPLLIFSYPATLLGYPVLSAIGWIKKQTTSSVVAGIFHLVGLAVLFVLGIFNIPAIAILRCCTEAVLMGMRAFFVWQHHRTEAKSK